MGEIVRAKDGDLVIEEDRLDVQDLVGDVFANLDARVVEGGEEPSVVAAGGAARGPVVEENADGAPAIGRAEERVEDLAEDGGGTPGHLELVLDQSDEHMAGIDEADEGGAEVLVGEDEKVGGRVHGSPLREPFPGELGEIGCDGGED